MTVRSTTKTKTKPASTGELLTREEAAERLGCSPKTLRNAAYERRGPRFIKMGKRALYPADEIARVRQAAIEGKPLGWDA